MEREVVKATTVRGDHGDVPEGCKDRVPSVLIGGRGPVGHAQVIGSHILPYEPEAVVDGDGGPGNGIPRLGSDGAVDPGTCVPLDVYDALGDGADGVVDDAFIGLLARNALVP